MRKSDVRHKRLVTRSSNQSRVEEELRQSERQLKEAKDLLQKVLDTIPMPIFWKDMESNFLGCNVLFAKDAGKESPDQVIGKNDLSMTWHNLAEIYRKDDLEVLGKGNFIINEEEPHTSVTGELSWVNSTKVPLLDADGNIFGLLGTYEDITSRKVAEHELNYEKERLRITLLSIGDAVVATDHLKKITLMNSVAQELTGWCIEDALGKDVEAILNMENEETGEKAKCPVDEVLRTGNSFELANHTILIAKDGVRRAIEDSAAPIRSETGVIQGVVMVFRDVTERKKRQEEVLYISYHDSLTGLYNRRYFEEEIKRLDQPKYFPLSIIIGDVNGLKMVNDVLGHLEGDRFLVVAAQILKSACRSQDIIARWGGDEFIIVLPRTGELEAEAICDRIGNTCGESEEYKINISISLGCATRNNQQEDLAKVINSAEEVMYTQKMLDSRSYRNAVLESFKKTLFEKSHETEEHAIRLMYLSKKMGQAMSLPHSALQELELLGALHDIGKIGIPDSVLNKPGKLDPDEWTIMKRHSEIGCRIAQSVPEFVRISECILSHHERWDGKGYPRGLKGEEIQLLARILSVVDAYDAMTSERPYRKPMDQESALKELCTHSGTQFDPELVQLFMDKKIYDTSLMPDGVSGAY